jgi:type IV pilus assembly protein PilW
MTHGYRLPGVRNQRGFTLIELMVSLTIGLLISVAVFSAYLGAASAARMSEAQARMNEDAQAAMIILAQHLRMAGSNPTQANRTDATHYNPLYLPYTGEEFSSKPTSFALSSFSLRGCDGPFRDVTTTASLDQLVCEPQPDQPAMIAVSYEADRFNTIPTLSGNLPTDCLGNALSPVTAKFDSGATTESYYLADNRFYIGAASNSGAPSLYCKGNGVDSAAQPLVENIEDLQLSFGALKMTTPSEELRTATLAGYLSASEVTGLTFIANDPAPWEKVITVRICVLVRSQSQVLADLGSRSYVKCDGSVATSTSDLRLRRAYSTLVVLRNRRI